MEGNPKVRNSKGKGTQREGNANGRERKGKERTKI